MNIHLVKETKNPLLGRKSVEFQIEAKITPSRKDVAAALAKALKVDEKLIVLDKVDQKTGTNVTIAFAKVYDNEELLKRVDLGYKQERGVPKKEGEAAAAPEAKK